MKPSSPSPAAPERAAPAHGARRRAARLSLLASVALLCVGCCLPAAAEDLLEVYAQARAADPVLAGARTVLGQQQELAVQARAPLLPQWSAQLSEERRQDTGARQHGLTHSLSQVLVDLSRLRSWDAARTLVDAEDERVRAAEADLCARVARAYFGVLTAQAALETAQAIEDVYGQQVAQAQSRFEAKLSASLDVEQARAYFELARGNTAQTRESLLDARQALAEITGRMPGTLSPLAPELAMLMPDPADPDAWVTQALRDNPSLRAAALAVDAGDQRVAAARAAHLPTLSAGLDGQRLSGLAAGDAAGRYNATVGLKLTIPLFAGGAVESQKRQAVFQREQLRDALEGARRAMTRETQAQYQAVLSSLSQMRTAGTAVQAAEKALASTRSGMDLGLRTMTDLLLAIQTQSNARNAWEQARHRYVLSKLLLQQAAGALGEPQLAAVNTLLGAAPAAAPARQ
ncbi:TolC family outer membrane protein [Mitsuaria sp. GD03876]|uniref:TolC family outer membrane protein n=1 Tax=Mitsuaria sp. GD03876 TaxID=2975399 RepID=UPI002449A8AE|nr:TolC family outer membrane protein [Mitsuaria sp. GD03876]MDH0866208.1 TolC family outer membrane protein [Mitsuaria sp. GD03876]